MNDTDPHQETREQVMNTLDLINDGKVNLDAPKPEMNPEYRALLEEFSKFTREVKMCIKAFNQNMYEMQQELAQLKQVKHEPVNMQPAPQQQPSQQIQKPPSYQRKPRQAFTEIHETVADNPEHPRTGSYTPEDVKIEHFFYCGNK